MEDGANPYLIALFIIIALIEFVIVPIILYKRSKQENITEEDVISLQKKKQRYHYRRLCFFLS